MRTLSALAPAALLLATPAQALGQFTLDTSGVYSQNFNGLGGGLPTGWTVNTGATASSIGTGGATFVRVANANGNGSDSTDWAGNFGAFKNFASASVGAGTFGAAQAAAADRALGVRQSAAFGNPGAAFTFQVSTANATAITGVRLDAQIVANGSRSTTWTVRYGLGSAPTSFATLGTYTDPPAFGSTTIGATFNNLPIVPDASNLVTFQVVALDPSSTGTGSNAWDSFAIDNFRLDYTPVPEPALVLSIAAGGLGVARLARRRPR